MDEENPIKNAFNKQAGEKFLLKIDGIVDPEQVRVLFKQMFSDTEPEEFLENLVAGMPEGHRPQISFNNKRGTVGVFAEMNVEICSSDNDVVLTDKRSWHFAENRLLNGVVKSEIAGRGVGTNYLYNILKIASDQGFDESRVQPGMTVGGYVMALYGAKQDQEKGDFADARNVALKKSIKNRLKFFERYEDEELNVKLRELNTIVDTIGVDPEALKKIARFGEHDGDESQRLNVLDYGFGEHDIDLMLKSEGFEGEVAIFPHIEDELRTLLHVKIKSMADGENKAQGHIAIGQLALISTNWNGYFDLTDPEFLPDFARRIGRKPEESKPSVQPLSNAAGSQMGKKR